MRWRRAILAGFPGLVLGWIAAWSINGQRRDAQTLSWPVMLIGVRGGPLLTPAAAGTGGTSLFHVFGYVGLFFSLVLILRVIIAISRDGI